jgi:hypothetical protein
MMAGNPRVGYMTFFIRFLSMGTAADALGDCANAANVPQIASTRVTARILPEK